MLADVRRYAFTLAEILVTLGIIGVVAAMTMPALIANHRKNVVETRLKHFYSTINQAITLSEVEHGDKNSWQPKDTEDFWNNYIRPYIKYLKAENSDSGQYKVVYLPNGSLFAVDVYSSKNSDGSISYQSYGGGILFSIRKLKITNLNHFHLLEVKIFVLHFGQMKFPALLNIIKTKVSNHILQTGMVMRIRYTQMQPTAVIKQETVLGAQQL